MIPIVAGASLASGIIKGIGSIVGGNASKAAGKMNMAIALWNAARLREDATNVIAEGVADEWTVRGQARQAIGAQMAAQGADGFEVGTGSARDALTESQINTTLDALQVRRNAQVRAREMRIEADNQVIGGMMNYYQGRSAKTQGLFGAATSILGAASDFAGAGGFK